MNPIAIPVARNAVLAELQGTCATDAVVVEPTAARATARTRIRVAAVLHRVAHTLAPAEWTPAAR